MCACEGDPKKCEKGSDKYEEAKIDDDDDDDSDSDEDEPLF